MRPEPWTMAITRRIPRAVGLLNRVLVRVPVVGSRVASGTAALAGGLLPSISALGFERSDTYDGAIANWENFLWRIGAEYERVEEGPTDTVYTFRSCPAGFTHARHRRACVASMELDRRLVEASGAALRVECRIPDDGFCVERIVAKGS